MKKTVSLMLVLLFTLLCFSSCRGESLVGTWECTENGKTNVLVLNEDGTGHISVDNVGMDITWKSTEGKYLTLTMSVSDTSYDYLKDAEYALEKNTLTVYENGNMAVYKRANKKQ